MAKRKPSTSSRRTTKKPKPPVHDDQLEAPEEEMMGVNEDDDVEAIEEEEGGGSSARRDHRKLTKPEDDVDGRFVGEPVPDEEARRRWPHRYRDRAPPGTKRNARCGDEDDELMRARRHYLKAEVEGTEGTSLLFHLYDNAHVKSEGELLPYICKIIELFEGEDGQAYFRAQWYYRSEDTVIRKSIKMVEEKRIFFSEVKDDNPLACLLEKVKIVQMKPNVDLLTKLSEIPVCDYYYDMIYLLPYSTFMVPPSDTIVEGGDSQSTISSDVDGEVATDDPKPDTIVANQENEPQPTEMKLLDLYCGCGAMSTGLCLGSNLCGVKLTTRWAVDLNPYACQSVALNHPETNVRNYSVENFLLLLVEWQKLCASYELIQNENTNEEIDAMADDDNDDAGAEDEPLQNDGEDEVFEVERILDICYGDPNKKKSMGLYFKVRWRGYGVNDDTWEPLSGMGNCRESVREFVEKGFHDKLFPLPGDVDIICGGPPCQGISGFNRFRNKENPLADDKNKQLLVFMDVVNFLKPKFVLMENVVDLVKFAKGFLGRYALGSLVNMNYQTRMGMMAAGAYGLPQFRMRVFIWGARPSEKLPQYPLPTHDLVLRGVIPTEFEINTVAYDEGHNVLLKDKLLLGDAISDMPAVANDEHRDEMKYDNLPNTEFQRYIRLTKGAMSGAGFELHETLYDHRPLRLNKDDHGRVCMIPKTKGANFRDLPGVLVRPDNTVEFDPNLKRAKLPSGKYVVPDYAMTFVGGTSTKPFGRLWWNETVPTVVTRAEPHNQVICHPTQDRVLTIRENARLQGFPDYYQLRGPVKQRYMQVGNAVAVPVARALGYSLALASQGLAGDEPLMTLPDNYLNVQEAVAVEEHILD